jgi:dTDP-4-amino-4,6-dideoxygalactose transaminase
MVREPADFLDRELGLDATGEANPWYYEMQQLGFNYRITDFACALGLSQLQRLDRYSARRRALQARYDRLIAPLAPLIRLVPPAPGDDPVLHLYAVLIDFAAIGKDRAEAMRQLKASGIGTMVHYIPVNRQPYYRQLYGKSRLPGAEAYYARVLSIPFYPAMQDSDVDRVVDALQALTR